MDEEFRDARERGDFPSLAPFRLSGQSLAAFLAACEADICEDEDELLEQATLCLGRCLALFGA